jgi:hypothetical protein
MTTENVTGRPDSLAPVRRVVRAFAEASVVAVGFALAILLLGLPVALAGRLLHDLIAWIAGS